MAEEQKGDYCVYIIFSLFFTSHFFSHPSVSPFLSPLSPTHSLLSPFPLSSKRIQAPRFLVLPYPSSPFLTPSLLPPLTPHPEPLSLFLSLSLSPNQLHRPPFPVFLGDEIPQRILTVKQEGERRRRRRRRRKRKRGTEEKRQTVVQMKGRNIEACVSNIKLKFSLFVW